jgi:hypothetical protein
VIKVGEDERARESVEERSEVRISRRRPRIGCEVERDVESFQVWVGVEWRTTVEVAEKCGRFSGRTVKEGPGVVVVERSSFRE